MTLFHRRSTTFLACSFLAPVLLAGCVTDGPTRPRSQPSGVQPAKLITAADGAFTDTDANRYRDSSAVVVYVMGDSPGYHLPIRVPGQFTIRLESPRGQLIAEWPFGVAQTEAALRNLPPGPGYVFELDLRKSQVRGGTDIIDESEADLVAIFTTDAGNTIRARTSAPILIGPVSRGTW